jgi:MoxR-like ATPase
MRTTLTVGIALARLILCAHRAGRGVLLLGGTGLGKTAILQGLARQAGISYRRVDASVMEPSDLGGIPSQDAMRGGSMVYLRPAWMPHEETEPEGMLVIEEATRPHAAVKNGLLNLISEKQLNGHALPPKWSIHGTANPADERFIDAEEMDAAFAARFSKIEVYADRRDWLTWAAGHGVHRDVLAYVEMTPNIFSNKGIYIHSNPRSWTWISDFLNAVDCSPRGERPEPDEILAFITGLVGAELAQDFLARRAQPTQQTLTANDLLTDYRSAHRHQVRRFVDARQLAEVATLANAVVKHLTDANRRQQVLNNPTQRENLADFINDLPGDIGASIFSRLPMLRKAL